MKAMKAPIAAIIVDTDLQSRARLDGNVVEEYAEAMRAGAMFPPLVIFGELENPEDNTTLKLYLADGFHRHAAAALVGREWWKLICGLAVSARHFCSVWARMPRMDLSGQTMISVNLC